MSNRPAIPTAIKSAVEQEAGYRCAVPTCRDKGPFDFEHIEDWSKVRKHEFHNIVLLCVGCHARVTRKEIRKSAIKAYKRNLAIINGRYSLYELRLLETFFRNGAQAPREASGCITVDQWMLVAHSDQFHLKGLIDDEFVNFTPDNLNKEPIDPDFPNRAMVNLSQKGVEFVNNYFAGIEIE